MFALDGGVLFSYEEQLTIASFTAVRLAAFRPFGEYGQVFSIQDILERFFNSLDS